LNSAKTGNHSRKSVFGRSVLVSAKDTLAFEDGSTVMLLSDSALSVSQKAQVLQLHVELAEQVQVWFALGWVFGDFQHI
jgi:hypothetical protein